MEYLIIAMLIFMLIAAPGVLWTDELFSAVIAVAAVGVGSSAAFLFAARPQGQPSLSFLSDAHCMFK